MKNYYGFNILRKIIIQMCDMFNDILIARYDTSGDIVEYVKVPLLFAPKSKQYYFVQKQDPVTLGWNRNKVFPIMALNLVDIQSASDRQTNKLAQITLETNEDDRIIKNVVNKVPYNFSFELSIATLYYVDMSQILEQILPFFTPIAYIRMQIPELSVDTISQHGMYPLDMKVIYNSSSPSLDVELPEDNERVIEWRLGFTVEGFLFQPITATKYIKKVVNKIYTSDETWAERYTTTEPVSGNQFSQETIVTYATHNYKYDSETNILSAYEIFTEKTSG